MTSATMDAIAAGMRPGQKITKVATPTLVVGRPQSLWYLAGIPGAGAIAANTAGGVVLSSSSTLVAGQIPHTDPGSGSSYLARLVLQATTYGTIELRDRLMQICGNSGGTQLSVTLTTAQTINSITLPARDNDGATSGNGVYMDVEIAATMGAGTPTFTISYTNQAGTSGRTSTNIDSVLTTSALGASYRMSLQAGDTGVQSVQSITLSATMVSGQISIVLYRQLEALDLSANATPNSVDFLTGGGPNLPNGAVPYLVFLPASTTASFVSGQFIETQF